MLAAGDAPLSAIERRQLIDSNLAIPPLYCGALIAPDAPGQGGQEKLVAKYPLAIVPQDDRAIYRTWRNEVHRFNPEIKLLAYFDVNKRTNVPGPGHDYMLKLRDVVAHYPGGFVPDRKSVV